MESQFSPDFLNSVVLLGLMAILVLAYAVRVISRGRAHFARVDREGSSALVNKNLMEMVYWGLQPVARLLVFFHITPNMISWTSLGFGLVSGICLAFGHFGFGAGFAMVSALCDALDGLIARETHVASESGEVVDATIDRYSEFFFLMGLAVYYREIPFLLITVLFALIGSFMVSYSTAKAETFGISPPRGHMRRTERAVYLVGGAAFSPITIPIFEQATTYPVPIGYPMVLALGLVALLANVSAIERFIAISKSLKTRAQNPPPTRDLEEEAYEVVSNLSDS